MNRKYWLDLFTGKTWEEFKKHGAVVTRMIRQFGRTLHFLSDLRL